MWEMLIDFSWDGFNSKKFDNLEDAQWVMRGIITKMLGKDGTHFSEFLQMIDDSCKRCYAQKPIPEALSNFVDVLKQYVTNPAYPYDVDNFTFEAFEDENIKITMGTNPKTLKMLPISQELQGKFPSVILPLEMEQNPKKQTAFFISNKSYVVDVPNVKNANIVLVHEENDLFAI